MDDEPTYDPDPFPPSDTGWDRMFTKLERRLTLAQGEMAEAPRLVATILGAPEAARDELIRTSAPLRTPAVCNLLLERSFAQGFGDPARAIELADLAVWIAEALDEAAYGVSVAQDLRARSWAYLGNARRLSSDFLGAEQALTVAEAHLERGSADPLAEARVLDFKASLLSDRGWFEEAADLLDVVIDIYEEIRDSHRQGRALIGKGLFLGYAGRPEEAVASISAGLARISVRDREPRLELMAHHNLAWCLADCGRAAEARDHLEGCRGAYGEFADEWTALRLLWLESRIALGLGRPGEAEAGLREARERFLAQGLGYEGSMVTLDLVALYLEQGRTAEVKVLAREMLPLFLAQDNRHLFAALAAFQQAVQMDRATPRLARELTTYLRRARHNPGLRFGGL